MSSRFAVFGGGRGALLLIAGLLAASAVLRIAAGADQALALARSEHAETDVAKKEPLQCSGLKDLGRYLEELNGRKEALDKRERSLAEQARSIEFARNEIKKNLAALEEAERKVSATMTRAATAAEDDVARLTAVYENMKPKDAAALFEKMAPEFAAGFVARMRPDAAAQIMAGLSPETAYSVSVILAGRNAEAGGPTPKIP